MTFYRSCCIRKTTSALFWKFTSRYSTQTTQTADKVNKTILTELRKKTGFSYFKCSNALKTTNNNMEQAEQWLNEQAEKEGWVKAEKLQSRSTNQGLVGVLAKENYAALVQVGCETDFVARNALFQELVAITAQSTINFRQQVISQNLKVSSFGDDDIGHLREFLIPHKIQTLPVPNQNISIEEYVVSLVGKIGENIKIKKALAISTNKENIIGISSHGNISTTLDSCVMGTYGAAIVLRPLNNDVDRTYLSGLAHSLSQHVIGMNPKCLNVTDDVAAEDALLGQEFLLDPSKCVGDLVDEAGIEVIDFVRYGIND